MHDSGSLRGDPFLGSLLNGLSRAMRVQCAFLDTAGHSLLFSDVPKRVDGLPYDITRMLVQANWISRGVRQEWEHQLRSSVSKIIAVGGTRSICFESSRIKLVQLVAPIIVRKDCIGLLVTGKIPVGNVHTAESFRKELGTNAAPVRIVAKMVLAVGITRESAISDRLSVVGEFADMVSRFVERDSREVEQRRSFGGLKLDLDALDNLIHSINGSRDCEEMLNVIVQEVRRLVGADLATIALLDRSSGELNIRATASPRKLARTRFDMNRGIKGLALRRFRPVLVRDLEKETQYRHIYVEVIPHVRSELAVPFGGKGGMSGVVNVESTRPNAFGRDHVKVLTIIAGHVTAALKKVELEQARDRQLRAFSQATSKLGPQFELRDTLHSIVQNAIAAVNGSVGNIKLYDDRTGLLEFCEISDSHGKSIDKRCMRRRFQFRVWEVENTQYDSLSAWTFRNMKSRLTADAHAEPLWRSPRWKVGSCLHVPLMSGRRCIGVLVVDGEKRNAFSFADLKVLRLLAKEAVMAIENQWHHSVIGRISSFMDLQVPFEKDPARYRAAVLSELAKIVWEEMKPRACSVILPYKPLEGGDYMYIPEGCEYGIVGQKDRLLPRGSGLYSEAVSSRRIAEAEDVLTDRRFFRKRLARESRLKSAIAIPIDLGGDSFGSLNYYSSYKRRFGGFERHVLKTICGVAGLILSASETEKVRRERMMDSIGTGITLIGLPPDWEERKQAFRRGEPDWNLDIRMPLLFINKTHAEKYAPGAAGKIGTDCYKVFNNPEFRRPCWWCPVLRAAITGKTTTYFTHSPIPTKRRIEHFKVTASVYEEGGRPFAAVESTIPVSRELEARHFTNRMRDVHDEDKVIDLATECLGRGSPADCVVFLSAREDPKDIRIERIYTARESVLISELTFLGRWNKDVPFALPPSDEYFKRRERESLYLFTRSRRLEASQGRLSQCANEILKMARCQTDSFFTIPPHKLLSFFDGTHLLHESDFPTGKTEEARRPPKAIILRIGSSQNPLQFAVLLDKKPREQELEEPDHERYWCEEITSELTTKLEGIYSRRAIEELAKVRDAVFKSAPVGVVRTDAQGTILETNPAWDTMVSKNTVGRNLLKMDCIRSAHLDTELRRALRGTEVSIEQRRLSTGTGRELVISARCVPMHTGKGSNDGLLVTFWDMTDVAKQYDELINSREILVLGNLAAGATHEIKTAIITADHAIGLVASAVAKLAQLGNWPFLLKMNRQDWIGLHQLSGKFLRWVRSYAKPLMAPLPNATNRIEKLLSRKNLPHNDTQVRTLAKLDAAQELSRLLGRCDDDIVKPLFSYIMELATVAAFSNITSHSISQVREITRSLRMQTFVAPKRAVRADIHDTINAALIILGRELARSKREIAIQTRYSGRIPDIKCSPGQLTQLWRNAIMNSITAIRKTRHRGKIWISTRRKSEAVLITIKDNGIGIPKNFDLNTLGMSLPVSDKKAVGGYGLWIIRRVITNHGGSLEVRRVRSPPGTVIRVQLPIRST